MNTPHSPLLQAYLAEVGRVKLLTAAEEQSLARRLRAGDRQARTLLVQANLRLAVSVACRFQGRGLELADLVAEANLGVIRAAEKFDPDAGCRFSTYATWWIKQAVRIALRNQVRMVRLPSHMIDRLSLRLRVQQQLSRRLGRLPTEGELASALDLDATAAARLRESADTAARAVTTLSPSPGRADRPTPEDTIVDRQAEQPGARLEQSEERLRLTELVRQLDPRRRQIVEMRFGLLGESALTLAEVGLRLGLTRERVRQLQEQAMGWLRIGLAHGDEALRACLRRTRAPVEHEAGA